MSHLSPTYVKTMLHMLCSDAALSELEHGGGHTPTGAGSHSQVLERGVLYLLRSCWSRSTFKFVQGASRQIQVIIYLLTDVMFWLLRQSTGQLTKCGPWHSVWSPSAVSGLHLPCLRYRLLPQAGTNRPQTGKPSY